MAAKKKKATAASRLPAGTASLPASKAGDRVPSADNKVADLPVNSQQVEEAKDSWPLHGPMIEYESCDEKCAEWGSNSDSESEGFLDDDMDFSTDGKAKLKKEKSQVSAAVVAACREEIPTASDRNVGFSCTLVNLKKSCDNAESVETMLEASCDQNEQVVSKSVIENIKVINSTSSLESSCPVCSSRPSEIVASNTTITKPTAPEAESSIKLFEKMARQERDLKSAKTQAFS
ncbi:hypothetical protein EAE96_007889 [Botrytis aclada]|nr:hypothetical protein EAE96_007889 [Botrytis aclada]